MLSRAICVVKEARQMRRLVWLSKRSARSKTRSVSDVWGGMRGVFGIVACAATPKAALRGVAGTGVP